MTGMARKAARLARAKRLTADGLPRDARDWTEADWRDLHEAIEQVKRKIAERHKEDCK